MLRTEAELTWNTPRSLFRLARTINSVMASDLLQTASQPFRRTRSQDDTGTDITSRGQPIGEGSDESDSSPTSEEDKPLVQIKVHPNDLAWLLARAKTPEIREALQRGDALPFVEPCRLLLSKSEAATRSSQRKARGGISEAWEVLYREAKEWWSREATL